MMNILLLLRILKIVKWLPWVNYKNLNGNVIQVPYAIGEALLGVVAYFLRNSSYVTLQWTVSVACFIQVYLDM